LNYVVSFKNRFIAKGCFVSVFDKKYWLELLNPKDIIKTTIQTIVGTVLIGSFFLVASDYIFPVPNIHGKWKFTTMPTSALSTKHSIMQLTYTIRIFQEGDKFKGIGEKIKAEIPKNNYGIAPLVENYDGKSRVKIEIEGYIENNYFAQDKIRMIYTEGGSNGKGPRDTVTIQNLFLTNNDELTGYFDSTISDSVGKVIWNKY
jgi:hypothetical protein